MAGWLLKMVSITLWAIRKLDCLPDWMEQLVLVDEKDKIGLSIDYSELAIYIIPQEHGRTSEELQLTIVLNYPENFLLRLFSMGVNLELWEGLNGIESGLHLRV